MTGDRHPRSAESLSIVDGEHVDVIEAPRYPVWLTPVSAGDRRRTSAASSRTGRSDRTVLTLVFALFLELYAVGRASQISTLALVGALGALFFGVGTAPLQFSPTVSLVTRLAVAGLLGLSTALLIGFLMVLAPLWHPDGLAILLVTAAGVAHAMALPAALEELQVSSEGRSRSRDLLRAWTRP